MRRIGLLQIIFLRIFDSPQQLQRYILDLHREKRDWPELLDFEWGMFGAKQQGVSDKAATEYESNKKSSNEILDMASKISGASRADIMENSKGRGANPARRFALMALVKHTHLTQREIEMLLNMSVSQVSNVIYRFNPRMEPFTQWMNKLEEKV